MAAAADASIPATAQGTSSSGPSVSSGSGSTPPTALLQMALGRLKESAMGVFKQAKPWSELVDRSSLSKPENLVEATSRLRKNATYFRINYIIISLALCLLAFVMNPSSLFVLGALMGGWIYLLFVRTTPVVLGGRTLSEREKLMGMSAISFITIFFLTSVGAVLFSALSFSIALVCLHGAMREPDNLFVDDGETQPTLMSILTGGSAAQSTSGPSAV